jgi:hypothetical protein
MARDPISRGYRQAKKIAHAVEHPDKWLEQQFLKTLPPAARQLQTSRRQVSMKVSRVCWLSARKQYWQRLPNS